MRHRGAWWPMAISVIALALLLVHAPASSARKLQMSGTWVMRNGSRFLPLQFAATLMGSQRTATSMGNLSQALGAPNGPIPGAGVVTAAGSAPATLVVPRHRFQMQASTLLPAPGVTVVQLTTMFAIDGPFESAVLAPGDGPGSFTWCPAMVLGCPATGPPRGGIRNGRIIYRAGPNRFGGSMRMGLAVGGSNSFLFDLSPFRVGHGYYGAFGSTPRVPAAGEGTPSLPETAMVYFPPGLVTQPTITPTPDELVLHPGPKLTTMFGLSTTATGPIFRLPQLGTSAMGMPLAQYTTEFGFAHTTGTVIVQQTAGSNGDDFFTVMGSDMRTALGAGNISTVAGGISYRNSFDGQTAYATFHKVWLSLAPPVPSLSPSGVAAAGALLLLAAGYVLRR